MSGAENLSELVCDGRNSRALYIDPEIFELELIRIFGRAWIYAGHDSQVRSPGDFFTTRIGKERIIVARQSDGGPDWCYRRSTDGAHLSHALHAVDLVVSGLLHGPGQHDDDHNANLHGTA
jgi:hypothetical protein